MAFLHQLLERVKDWFRALGKKIHHWFKLLSIAVVLWMAFIFFWYVFPGYGAP